MIPLMAIPEEVTPPLLLMLVPSLSSPRRSYPQSSALRGDAECFPSESSSLRDGLEVVVVSVVFESESINEELTAFDEISLVGFLGNVTRRNEILEDSDRDSIPRFPLRIIELDLDTTGDTSVWYDWCPSPPSSDPSPSVSWFGGVGSTGGWKGVEKVTVFWVGESILRGTKARSDSGEFEGLGLE